MESFVAQRIETEIKKYGMKSSKHATAQNGEYCVTSLYFDSYDLNDYYEKLGGLLNRKKLRARIYEPQLKESKVICLELKKKHDMRVHKKRLNLSPFEWQIFLEKGPASLLKKQEDSSQKEIKEEILWNFLAMPVRPIAIVRYLRKPYMLNLDFNDLRITFDRRIEACKADSLNYTGIMEPVRTTKGKGVIMEVKFAHLIPFWLRRIIQKYNLRRDTFSKYSNSIYAINRHDPLPE